MGLIVICLIEKLTKLIARCRFMLLLKNRLKVWLIAILIYNLPITMFRFFTVYGPWGRPDMALFKFTKAILENKEIDVYNYGEMRRDFTYIDDLVAAIILLISAKPDRDSITDQLVSRNDSKPGGTI